MPTTDKYKKDSNTQASNEQLLEWVNELAMRIKTLEERVV